MNPGIVQKRGRLGLGWGVLQPVHRCYATTAIVAAMCASGHAGATEKATDRELHDLVNGRENAAQQEAKGGEADWPRFQLIGRGLKPIRPSQELLVQLGLHVVGEDRPGKVPELRQDRSLAPWIKLLVKETKTPYVLEPVAIGIELGIPHLPRESMAGATRAAKAAKLTITTNLPQIMEALLAGTSDAVEVRGLTHSPGAHVASRLTVRAPAAYAAEVPDGRKEPRFEAYGPYSLGDEATIHIRNSQRRIQVSPNKLPDGLTEAEAICLVRRTRPKTLPGGNVAFRTTAVKLHGVAYTGRRQHPRSTMRGVE